MSKTVEMLGKDYTGQYIDYSLPQASTCRDIVLDGTNPQTVNVPAGYNRAFFSATINFWATLDGSTPVIPSAGVSTSTQELNPGIRQLDASTPTIKLISNTAGDVNIRFDVGQPIS